VNNYASRACRRGEAAVVWISDVIRAENYPNRIPGWLSVTRDPAPPHPSTDPRRIRGRE